MLAKHSLRLGACGLLWASASSIALAQSAVTADETTGLETITIEAEAISPDPAATLFTPADPTLAPGADGGERLRSVPGVTAGRMGGHGLEPVIRGQSQNQLNIIDAGAQVFGGCPNRMDPPTAAVGLDRADRVIVERGYHTVTNGPGGSGGAVILERGAPVFEQGEWWTLSGSTGFTSNSETGEADLQGALSLGDGVYLKGFGGWREADDYEDGGGDEVRSSYRQFGGGGEIGLSRERFEFALGADYDKTEDALFPGAGMDSPLDEIFTYRLRGEFDVDAGALREIKTTAYLSQVDHVMDNYSLRPAGAMFAQVPSESDTVGGKIEGLFDFSGAETAIGIDLQSNNRDATLYSGMALGPVASESSAAARFFMWPDVTIAQYGLYAETRAEATEDLSVKIGGRYDYVRAEAGKADRTPGGSGSTPNDFYRARYGVDFSDVKEEHNLGALLRLDYALTPDATLFLGLSRSARTADATERAMARSNWVGNPEIDPEKHHQADLGLRLERPSWSVGAAAYVDRVDDFILRDAFTVAGVTTYRNIDATLAGLELEGVWRSGGFELSGDAAYTFGENETDHMALAQIPPFSGKAALSYGAVDWRLGGRLNWALKQGRVDLSRDVQETPGYATVDLFGFYELTDSARLSAGVTNLLDEEYAYHLNRSNISDPSEVQVNEPGRSAYLRLDLEF